jgi:uncharacterized protein YgiB involved in biofilm formation
MRKSRYISLLLAGAAATALAGCDQNTMTGQDETLYPDVTACTQERDAAECNAGFEAARQEHVKEAPKFATKEECEAAGFQQCEVGQVQTAQGGSTGMFMPLMMGYMMGRTLGGMGGMGGMGQRGPAPGAPPAGGTASAPGTAGPAARPVYSDRNGYLYAGRTAVGLVAPGTTSLGSRAIPMRTAARGGFGGSARSFSGGS